MNPEVWGIIVMAVPAALTLLWGVSQLTKNTTDDKIVLLLRQVWGMIPVGERDPKRMGK